MVSVLEKLGIRGAAGIADPGLLTRAPSEHWDGGGVGKGAELRDQKAWCGEIAGARILERVGGTTEGGDDSLKMLELGI